MSRRNWFVVGFVLVLLMGGLWLIGTLRNLNLAAQRAVAPLTPTAVAESLMTAKGNIVPNQFARLSFGVNGAVAQIFAQENGKVKQGDVIAQLDTRDLKLHIQNAQDALDIALTTLAQAKTPATSEDISAAEANLRTAQTNFAKVKSGVSAPELQIAQANLAKAQAAVAQAQAAYDKIGGASNPEIGMTPQALALQQATLDYQIAKANYDLKVRADVVALAAAEAAVLNAQAIRDAKKNGARPADLAILDARVKQAQTALEQAQAALTKALLVAPFDGTLTQLALRPGESISAGAVIATIADTARWRVETIDLDEWGAARVKIGQPVKVTVNALGNKVLLGKVIAIASQATMLSTGEISYVVTIALDPTDLELRWGMSVKVEFQKQ
ncbi:MAG: efflux RND transporter periplasmic adaptor subunit [Anaerolineales bacterium]|nr:efflux RND transporter periplasmic adaptor subunit [Anaerolineales bacterium]